MDSARKLATYADLLDLPAHHTGQIIDGVLHVAPRPAIRHAAAATGLGEEIGPPFRQGRGGPGGWIILDEPELHLGGDILVADLSGWRRELVDARAFDAAFVSIAPHWVCEVLSPSTAQIDRGEKLRVYQREGVAHLWIVDPANQTLEIFRLDGATYRIVTSFGGNARVRAEPFDAIEINLAALWMI